jgi:hypothetical protein
VIETLSLGPVIARAPITLNAPAPASPVRKKARRESRWKLEPPSTVAASTPGELDKKLSEGTWIVDGRVVDAASFPADVKEMAHLAASMARLAGKMTIAIDTQKMRTTR